MWHMKNTPSPVSATSFVKESANSSPVDVKSSTNGSPAGGQSSKTTSDADPKDASSSRGKKSFP